MKLTTVWIVRDPTPMSELQDIVWEQLIERLDRYVFGAGPHQWSGEDHTMFTDKDEAVGEATGRLVRVRPERAGWIADEAYRVFGYGAPKGAAR
jgi:hypothetical protein